MHFSTLVALEIGTAKVAVAIAERHSNGALALLGHACEPSSGVRKGEIVQFDDAAICVRSAMRRAAEMADVSVEEVHLVVSGAHVQTLVNRAVVPVLDPESGIADEDLQAVRRLARHYPLPADRKGLHALDQYYYLDDTEPSVHPEGIEALRLTHDMLLFHVSAAKVRTAVRVVREMGTMNVCDMAFGGWCSALAVTTPAQRESGVLVLDLGAGTSDYFVFMNGLAVAAGTLGVGGDHVANDVREAFDLPFRQAEALVRAQGTLEKPPDSAPPHRLPPEDAFLGATIDARSLQAVLHARLRETLGILRDRINLALGGPMRHGELILTGGGSRLRGIHQLAGAVWGRPFSSGRAWNYQGPAAVLESPEYATVLGMLRYADQHPEPRRQPSGWMEAVDRYFARFFKPHATPQPGENWT